MTTSETTRDALRAVLSWLATYGLHSTLFLGAAWLLCRLRPPAVNRNRERVWKLALVGGLLSATLQHALGARPILGRIAWQPAPAAPVSAVERDAPGGGFEPTSGAMAGEGGDRRGSAHGPGASTPARPMAAAPRPDRIEPDRIETKRVEPARVESTRTPPPSAALARTVSPFPGTEAAEQPEVAAGQRPLALEPRLTQRLRRSAASLSARWPALVVAGWGAIGLLGLAGLLASWGSLRRRMLGRERLQAGPLVELLEHVRARAGVRMRIRLSVSARITAPFSTGFFRPEVCVPRAVLTQLTRAQQEALLAHELAHLVRRDPAWFGLGFLIEKLFFFQPLNRLARRRLSELAEVACDDWAVRWTGARVALASCLAEVAGWVIGEPRRLAAPPGLAGQRSRLGQRVERLLDDRRSPANDPPAPWWPPLAAGALAFTVLAVPGVSSAETRSASPSARPPSRGPTWRPERLKQDQEHGSTRPGTTSPEIEPAALPAAAVTEAAEPAPNGFVIERGVLESELALLEAELAALHTELEARALRTHFAAALERIDGRMDELRAQHTRARELLARLSDLSPAAPAPGRTRTPAPGPEPDAAAPVPTVDSGDPR